MAETVLAFVYGALKRGLALEGEMRRAGAEFVGQAAVRGDLYDLGPYPAAVPGRGMIHGELYSLAAAGLEHLDCVEGNAYRRRIVTVFRENGQRQKAWVYFYRRGRPARARLLPEGRYPPVE